MLKLLGVSNSGFDGVGLGKIGRWCGKLAASWGASAASWSERKSGPAGSRALGQNALYTGVPGLVYKLSGGEYLGGI